MTGPGGPIIIATTWTRRATRRWSRPTSNWRRASSNWRPSRRPAIPNYVPAGLDRDLMYSDHYVAQAYSNRPTTLGVIAFWVLGVPMALAFVAFFIWLIWFKRWQTATWHLMYLM